MSRHRKRWVSPELKKLLASSARSWGETLIEVYLFAAKHQLGPPTLRSRMPSYKDWIGEETQAMAMIVSEDEAREKLCPQKLASDSNTPDKSCEGCRCMAWQPTDESGTPMKSTRLGFGYCGLVYE